MNNTFFVQSVFLSEKTSWELKYYNETQEYLLPALIIGSTKDTTLRQHQHRCEYQEIVYLELFSIASVAISKHHHLSSLQHQNHEL